MSEPNPDALITLTGDEAIVLFGLLARWIDSKECLTPSAEHFESPAECAALHALFSNLEKQLATPFQRDYVAGLRQARQRVAGQWSGRTLRD